MCPIGKNSLLLFNVLLAEEKNRRDSNDKMERDI